VKNKMIYGLQSKEIDPYPYAEKLIINSELISQYLDGLLSKNETYRYNCFKVLNVVSEKKPELLYPYWNFFINHLNSDNNYHQMSAVIIIANIIAVDKEQRFEDIFDSFYENLKSEKTIVPIYIIKTSGKIIKYKPHLKGKITDLLINIEKIHPGKQIELVKSAVIESFSEIFKNSSKKDEIMSFVKNQLNSTSPKTKKAAKEFLCKWGEN
jgi:hypothetical protein